MYGQLQRSFYENVRACFEVKEGAAGMSMHKEITHVQLTCYFVSVQVSDDRRGELTLERVIRVLEYILKEELVVLQPGEELTRPSLDLLATIFDYCEEVLTLLT